MKKCIYLPTLIYGCEALVWHEYEKSRIRTVEIDCLRSGYEVRRIDRMINVVCEIYVRIWSEKFSKSTGRKNVFKWYEYMEGIENDRLVKIIYTVYD